MIKNFLYAGSAFMFLDFCSGRHIETVRVCSKCLKICNFIKSSESLRNHGNGKIKGGKVAVFKRVVVSFSLSCKIVCSNIIIND